MPVTSGLGLIATLDSHASEYHGQNKIYQRCDGRGSQTLDNTPDSLVSQQRLVECFPNLAKVGQVDEEDGDEGVGSDPEQGENEDPKVVGHALATASRGGQRHVGPDDVHWLRGQDDGAVVGMLLAARVGNTVRLGNVRVTSKSVGHRATLVDRGSDFFDFNLEILDTFGVVVDGIELLVSRIAFVGTIFLGRLARWAVGRERLRVLEVLGKDFLKLADGVFVLLNEVGEILDVSGDSGACKR